MIFTSTVQFPKQVKYKNFCINEKFFKLTDNIRAIIVY